MMVRAKWNL